MSSFDDDPDDDPDLDPDAPAEDPLLESVAASLAADPDQPYLRRRYGLLLFRRRRFREAAAEFSQLARMSSDNGEAFLFLSRALLRLEMYDFARAAAEMAARDEALLPTVGRVLTRIAGHEALTLQPVDPEAPDEIEASYAVAPAADDGPALNLDLEDITSATARLAAPERGAVGDPWHRSHLAALMARVDAFVLFLDLIKSLILRNITYTRKNKISALFMVGGKLVVIIFFHVIIFYATARTFPGQISLLSATLAPFLVWSCCTQAQGRVAQASADRAYNRNVNVKWIHLFIADVVWDMTRILGASVLIVFLGDLFLWRPWTFPVTTPNIGVIFAMAVLAVNFGAGLGLLMNSLERRWPLVTGVDHILHWLLFITCGLYDSYVTAPTFLQPYIKINPILTLTEYTRLGFDPSYPVGDLTLWYPFGVGATFVVLGLALRVKATREWSELHAA